MMRAIKSIGFLAVCLGMSFSPVPLQSQPPSWTRADKADVLHGVSFVQFTLAGSFVVPPAHGALAEPSIVLD
ncbi:MAG: hypothetical protein ACRDV0_10745, partial [Acidimicrobiales bacterium]